MEDEDIPYLWSIIADGFVELAAKSDGSGMDYFEQGKRTMNNRSET